MRVTSPFRIAFDLAPWLPFQGQTSLVRGLAALAALCPLAAAQAVVLVVDDDGGPGVDHAELQAAVDVAPPGAVLLVKGGHYGSVSIDNKSLTIAVERDAEARIFGTLAVSNIGPTQSVTVRGLDVLTTLNFDAVQVVASAGTVLFEDCEILNNNMGQFGRLTTAMIVDDCARVAFIACTFKGSIGGAPLGGGDGLLVRNASAHLYGCSARGGPGAIGDQIVGGSGLAVDGGRVFASGGAFTGGTGGSGHTMSFDHPPYSICFGGGAGGTAVALTGSAPSAQLIDVTLTSGAGGAAPSACASGPAGPASLAPAGTLQLLGGHARAMVATSPVREQETAVLAFTGQPFDYVCLILGFGPTAHYVGTLTGSGLVALGASRIIPLGPTDGGGILKVHLDVPSSVPSGTAARLMLQPVFLDAHGGAQLGAASSVTVLSAAL